MCQLLKRLEIEEKPLSMFRLRKKMDNYCQVVQQG